ncbi:hypothetical protein BHM03_00011697 [Ensete ventricosum]|nr:hypothetical protein BHM03_00011697 [Ensete ventricosum]
MPTECDRLGGVRGRKRSIGRRPPSSESESRLYLQAEAKGKYLILKIEVRGFGVIEGAVLYLRYMIGTIPACQSAIFRKAGLDMSKWGMGCTTAVVGRLSPFGRVEVGGRHGDDGITSVACGGGGAAYLAAAAAGKPVLEQHGAQLYSLRPVPCAERDSISTSSACMIRQNTWACSPSMKLSLCGRDRPMVADADSSSQKVAWAIDHGIA